MKNIGLGLTILLLSFSMASLAQSPAETALLFSRINQGGSARIVGLGGAQTSLGGDYSSGYSNPAGLGMFNKSEITFSPGFNNSSIKSDYLGNSNSATNGNIHIPGMSFVFQSEKDGNMGLLSGAFAISFNRVNNFNQNYTYEGTNDKNSIIDYFIQDATGFSPNSFKGNGDNFNTPTGLAYNNYLIEDSTFVNPNASNLDYMSVLGTFPNPNDIRTQLQHEDVKTSGAQNQWSFSYGANFTDKIFVGAGIGVTSLRYQSKKTYTESNFNFALDPTFKPLDHLTLNEELKISGSGINATFGVIARPVDIVQVGLSYTTPTAYALNDTYSATMNTQWNNFDYYNTHDPKDYLNNVSERTDIVNSQYTLKTPGRLNVGATVFLKKYGFLTADAQLINYSGAKYTSKINGVSYDSDNARVKDLYQSAVNIRLGGEFRYNDYRLRAGYGFMPEPFKSEQNGVSRKISSYSVGAGYRSSTFYLDIAAVLTQGNSSYRPYRVNSADSPLVKLSNQNTLVMVTLGFPF